MAQAQTEDVAKLRAGNIDLISRMVRPYDALTYNTEISENDAMFDGNAQGYFNTGKTLLHAINVALQARAIPLTSVNRILDFGCGHGRVTRMMRGQWPEAEITAHDIVEDAVRFCTDTLECVPSIGPQDINQTQLSGTWDLIVCGSIFTHLDVTEFRFLLRKLASCLTEDGVLVLSTAGGFVVELAKAGFHGGAAENTVTSMIAGYVENGFAFGLYKGQETRRWGWTFAAPWWVAKVAQAEGLKLVSYTERGWGGRQDVVGLVRS